jgi:hypothetical protein
MIDMQLTLRKLSVNLAGRQKKHLKKVDYAKQFSGIWTIRLGGRESFQVLVEWKE